MNKQELDILKILYNNKFENQRKLAEISGHSLGVVNRSITNLVELKYLKGDFSLSKNGKTLVELTKPQNAIILAAGFGMRMVPINVETPKALLEVKGRPLIERTIEALKAVGINDITIVVGFKKEQFEYLIDKYDIELAVNADYASKNNLHSLALVSDKICNTYVIPSDIYFENNPFSEEEVYSWYLVDGKLSSDCEVKVNRKNELVRIRDDEQGNHMIGISYITNKDSDRLKDNLKKYDAQAKYDNNFWEEALYENNKMIIDAKIADDSVKEINTYEQLREVDSDSEHLNNNAIIIAAKSLKVEIKDIVNIEVLKKGMTNRSFLFECKGSKYIMRIPGEGTDMLINRREEAEVYNTIAKENICDDIVYINPKNGFKITKYINDAKTCNIEDESDLKKCMKVLKAFHNKQLKVGHKFDIFKMIKYYESLWGEYPSAYRDYSEVKANILSLKNYLDSIKKDYCLTHIDAVPDNFLIYQNHAGKEEIRLIDWEYSGMQDPHVDIAMFGIYSLYNKEQMDRLIDIYFENKCEETTRTKIYAYVAICGFLWSNWCEYKRTLGVEFGEYSLRQYRYAKEYYRLVKNRLESI